MTELVLSERNLKTLLNKLQRYPESFCTIIKPCGTVVRAEPDAVHYGERVPGRMHPLDEPDKDTLQSESVTSTTATGAEKPCHICGSTPGNVSDSANLCSAGCSLGAGDD